MLAWDGWKDDSWREYYQRSLPAAIPVFADRLWNEAPVDDYEQYKQAIGRHVFGPALPDDCDIYDQLGGMILPTDSDQNQQKAHFYASLGYRRIQEAIEHYETTADVLQTQLDQDTVISPDAAVAYIDCLNWLIEVAEREGRGRPDWP